MKRKALWKDFFMEIKTTLNRFLSILFISALGVAFFAGIRSTNPDMKITADSYFDDSSLTDIRVISTWGLTDGEVAAISKVTGVEAAEPAHSTDVLCDTKEKQLVLRVLSATEKLNKITVTEGRMPNNENEVLVDSKLISSSGYKLGDTLKIHSGTDAALTDTLKKDKFTIVGAGTSSYYLSFQRGTSNIGNGDVDSFIVVLPEVFSMKEYSECYISVKDAKKYTAFTGAYTDHIQPVITDIEGISETQCRLRFDKQYSEAKKEIDDAKNKLEASRKQAEDQLRIHMAALQTMQYGSQELQAAKEKLETAKKESELTFKEAENKITASETKLAQMQPPKWYVLDRQSIEAYAEYEQNADRIGAIGKVFPSIFFLVAALISLTTMTRMVEEERLQIGTLKALGYSKKAIAVKYILYALTATLAGSILGAMVGLKVLPTIIITAYKIIYQNIPRVVTPFNTYYAVLAALFAVLAVGLATFFSCYKELMAKPAQLMRPAAPRNGKRVLLERIGFIWNSMSFTWKATIRNLFRYKKRFFMTVFGIGGCMALLLVGFGLKDSIFVIYTRQFDEIMLYDSSVSIDKNAPGGEITGLEETLSKNQLIKGYLKVHENQADLSFGNKKEKVQLVVPEHTAQIKNYITFRSRKNHKPFELNDNEIILTEQIAKKIGVQAGDTITVTEGEKKCEAVIGAITENYMKHYVYMSPALYKSLYNQDPGYNQYYLLIPDVNEEKEQAVGNEILNSPAVTGIFYVSYFRNLLSNMLTTLNIVVWVLIIAAGLLDIIVLYNLNNININERKRELATIKVLGFYDNELTAYIYRENIILTMIGIAFGVVFGIFLHRYVIETVEIDLVMFGRNINPESYAYSVLLTLIFSALVNLVMFFRLRKINMVESLKSVE